MKLTLADLQLRKKQNIPISMATAYDYPTALIEDEAGIDSILIGDSVGTNVLGYTSEQDVSMADMLHHTRAVSRAVKHAFIIADMPFGSNNSNKNTLENAQLLVDSGADCVKFEGWREKKDTVEHLAKNGFCICAHIGYNPQIHGAQPRTFGKDAEQAVELIESAKILQESGAGLIVLEKVPVEIAAIISSRLNIPTIGIGSGKACDGQVLVANDLLGINSRSFKHSRKYMDFYGCAKKAFEQYKADVSKRNFPAEENTWHIDIEELDKVNQFLTK